MHLTKTLCTFLAAVLGAAWVYPGVYGQERFLVLDEDFQLTCIAADAGDVVFGEVEEAGVVKSVRWSETGGLTVIADGANDTHVIACNADGTVAVGYFVEASINRPFRWTNATGIEELTATGTDGGEARGCSADGSIVVGTFRIPQTFGIPRQRAFQWSESAGATLIPILPGGTDQNAATSCSDTGVAFGWSQSTSGNRPFRYSTVEGLSNLAAIGDAARANAELTLGSADGTAAAVNEAAFGVRPRTAVWRQDSRYQNLPLLSTDFNANTLATCISANGKLVAGDANVQGTASRHAFRWSPTAGMVDMGTLGGASSRATAVTGAGEHIYGIADTVVGSEAFVWEFTGGMRTLKSHAQNRLPAETEIANWRFGEMVVSRNGRRMFVEGTRTDNLTRVLFFDLEPPANSPPEIDPIAPVVLECIDREHVVSFASLVDDIDGQSMTVRWKVDGQLKKTTANVAPGSPIEFTFSYGHGSHSVVVEATDGFDTTTAGTTVTVQDTVAPAIVVAADVFVPTDSGKAFATGVKLTPPTSFDASGHTVTLTSDAPASYPLGVTVVTWTGRDIDGNTATGTQNVTVEDREAPRILAPTTVQRFCDPGKLFSTAKIPVPQATDNVSDGVTVKGDPKGKYPIGKTRVTWTSVDEAGNVARLAVNVVVVNRAPRANAGKNVVVAATSEKGVRLTLDGTKSFDPDKHPLKFRWIAPRVTLAGAAAKKAAGLFPIGATNVKLTVTDAAGATHTDTVLVTVKLKNSKPRPRGSKANEAFARAARSSERFVANGELSATSFAAYGYSQAAEGLGVAAGDLIAWNDGQSPHEATFAYAELRQLQRQYGEYAMHSLLAAYAEFGDEEALSAAMDAMLGTQFAAADLSEE